MRFPQGDNSVEDEDRHHSSCLIRRHGSGQPIISLSCLPLLQNWQKPLEFQQFHFLAAGFNIEAPSLNNKQETVSTCDANVIKNDAAPTAILLHHADIFPKAGGVIHPVLLRNSTVWWGRGGGHGISVFHHGSIHHGVTHLPMRQDSPCALPGVRRVWIFRVLNQEVITTIRDSWLGPDIVVYNMSSKSTILKKKSILSLLRYIPAPAGSVSYAEERPDLIL